MRVCEREEHSKDTMFNQNATHVCAGKPCQVRTLNRPQSQTSVRLCAFADPLTLKVASASSHSDVLGVAAFAPLDSCFFICFFIFFIFFVIIELLLPSPSAPSTDDAVAVAVAVDSRKDADGERSNVDGGACAGSKVVNRHDARCAVCTARIVVIACAVS